MQKKYSSYRLPKDLEDLSDFSNEDLRLSPEYAEVEEAYRKIRSFQQAVDLLEASETSYHDSVRAVGSAWPEAYEAFVSMDEALEEVPDKFEAEQVMNAGFEDFREEQGEVRSRRRELEEAIKDAREAYQATAGRLASQIKSSLFLGRETPLKYAKKVSDSEAFDRRAERLEKGFVRPENATGERVKRLLDGTDRP